MTFGIPKDFLPFNIDTGELDLTQHQYWIETRKQREQQLNKEKAEDEKEKAMAKTVNTNVTKAAIESVVASSASGTHVNCVDDHHNEISTPSPPLTLVTNPPNSGNAIDETLPPIECGREENRKDTLPVAQGDGIGNTNTSLLALLASTTNKEIIVPGPLDILLGKGKQPKSSVGYMKFRTLLEDHYEMYDTAERYDKTVIAGYLLKKLHCMGCRFVRRSANGGYLEECLEDEAQEKIRHTFRNIRSAKKQKEKNARKGRRLAPTADTTAAGGITIAPSSSKKRCRSSAS